MINILDKLLSLALAVFMITLVIGFFLSMFKVFEFVCQNLLLICIGSGLISFFLGGIVIIILLFKDYKKEQ